MSVDAPANPSHYTKGDPRAREDGRKSGEVRRANSAARAEEAEAIRAEAQAALEALENTNVTADNLAPHALAAVTLIIRRLISGSLTITNGAQAAALIRELLPLALPGAVAPAGSVTINLQVGDDEVRRRIAAARGPMLATGVASPPETETAPPVPELESGPPAPALDVLSVERAAALVDGGAPPPQYPPSP